MHRGKKWHCVFVVALLFGVALLARSEGPQPPEAVVSRYCALDAQGANFNANNPNAKEIYALLTDADEAGYDDSVIIRSYSVGKARAAADGVDVSVTYDDLGRFGGEPTARKKPHSEVVVFHLTKSEGSWKIAGLRLPPHISRDWMLSELRRELREDQKARKKDPKLVTAIAAIAGW